MKWLDLIFLFILPFTVNLFLLLYIIFDNRIKTTFFHYFILVFVSAIDSVIYVVYLDLLERFQFSFDQLFYLKKVQYITQGTDCIFNFADIFVYLLVTTLIITFIYHFIMKNITFKQWLKIVIIMQLIPIFFYNLGFWSYPYLSK